jgi:Flp pilus assembly protein protease CpaA
MNWFPILLVTHIALAVSLLAPSVLLPFLLRRPAESRVGVGPATRALMAMQGTGSLWIGAGLAASGVGLLAILGLELLRQPWLLVALSIYALNLLVAALVARPNLRRLLRLGAAGDEATWRRRARRQRYVAYGMALATGVIGFLMSTKPELW